jgi:hypothetical protein
MGRVRTSAQRSIARPNPRTTTTAGRRMTKAARNTKCQCRPSTRPGCGAVLSRSRELHRGVGGTCDVGENVFGRGASPPEPIDTGEPRVYRGATSMPRWNLLVHIEISSPYEEVHQAAADRIRFRHPARARAAEEYRWPSRLLPNQSSYDRREGKALSARTRGSDGTPEDSFLRVSYSLSCRDSVNDGIRRSTSARCGSPSAWACPRASLGLDSRRRPT